MCRPEANDVNEVTKNLSHHFNAPNHFSIFVGQQNTGRRTLASVITHILSPALVRYALKSRKPCFKLNSFSFTFRAELLPSRRSHGEQEIPRLLARFFERGQRTGWRPHDRV